MATVPNPMAALPPPPPIFKQTLHMAGILVDVYGLSELPSDVTHVSCLWLHHPRTRSRADMADIAARCVAAWLSHDHDHDHHTSHRHPARRRGLLALAFDQRNHGSRLVRAEANGAWREGNATHAQDMFGVVAGTVADQVGLLDAVKGYLFHEREGKVKIDQHLALGVSLGGHSVWQLMFADPRVVAGVVVIGCPDFMYLMSDRARLSKLSTYSAADSGATFLGSADFPPALVDTCRKYDPRAILFDTGDIPPTMPSEAEKQRLAEILDARVRDKKFLICSGGDDKLVPYRCSKPFTDWFKEGVTGWFRHGGVAVEDKVYPGVGHMFSEEMVKDAVQFVLGVVAGAENPSASPKKDDSMDPVASKI